jgi:uncharacterized protein RhaS with RHS repeats
LVGCCRLDSITKLHSRYHLGQALDYDANGNLIADGRWRYRYDAETAWWPSSHLVR